MHGSPSAGAALNDSGRSRGSLTPRRSVFSPCGSYLSRAGVALGEFATHRSVTRLPTVSLGERFGFFLPVASPFPVAYRVALVVGLARVEIVELCRTRRSLASIQPV